MVYGIATDDRKYDPDLASIIISNSISSNITRDNQLYTWNDATNEVDYSSVESTVNDWNATVIELEGRIGKGKMGYKTVSFSLAKLHSNGDDSYSPQIKFRWYPVEQSILQPFVGVQLIDFYNTGFEDSRGHKKLYCGLGAEAGIRFNINKNVFAHIVCDANFLMPWGLGDNIVEMDENSEDIEDVAHSGTSVIFGVGFSL